MDMDMDMDMGWELGVCLVSLSQSLWNHGPWIKVCSVV